MARQRQVVDNGELGVLLKLGNPSKRNHDIFNFALEWASQIASLVSLPPN